MRCSVGERTSAVPTATQGPSLYATASSGALILREVGAFNTTAVACAVGVSVATSQAGTPGTALTEISESDPTKTVLGEARNTGSGTAPTVTGEVRQASLGAAVGSGIIWTFGDLGLLIPEGTGNGVIITAPTGTGQHLDFYFVWDE